MALYEGMYDRAAGASGLLYLSVDGKGSRATVTVRAGKKGSRAAIRVISRNFKWGGVGGYIKMLGRCKHARSAN